MNTRPASTTALRERGVLGEEPVARDGSRRRRCAVRRRSAGRRAGRCRPRRCPAAGPRCRPRARTARPRRRRCTRRRSTMPSRRHVRMMRRAISPRLAMSTRSMAGEDTSLTSGTRRSRGCRRSASLSIALQAHAQHRAGVARVDDAVVVQLAGHEQRQRLALDLVLDLLAHRLVGLLVERLAHAGGRLAGDDAQHAGQLLRAHHRGLRVRPGEQEPRPERPAAHAVVAGAVRGGHVDGQVRHAGCC